jgi:hypothetical protein
MSVIANSGNYFALPTDYDPTIIVAPDVKIDGLDAIIPGARLVNYGTLSHGSQATVSFVSRSSGVFINKAGGAVTETSTNGGQPAVLIDGAANVSVINGGVILSNNHGISIANGANSDSVVNSGDLYAKLNGIWVSSSAAQNVTISNSGEIWGDANGIYMEGAQGAAPVIFNSGVIAGRANSIVATGGDRLNVTNTGTLEGNVVGNSPGLTDIVLNNGRILGNVKI